MISIYDMFPKPTHVSFIYNQSRYFSFIVLLCNISVIIHYTIYISIMRDFYLNIIPNVSKLLNNKIEPIINTFDIIE
jgi:hypothetical protein